MSLVPVKLLFKPAVDSAAGAVALVASNALSTNKRLPPKTMLLVDKEGRIRKTTSAGVPYGFSDLKALVCEKRGVVATIAELGDQTSGHQHCKSCVHAFAAKRDNATQQHELPLQQLRVDRVV